MIHADTMRFLGELARHPTREWFDDHRDDFVFAKRDLAEFVQSLLMATGSIDGRVVVANPDPRKCLSGVASRVVDRGGFSVVVRVSNDEKAIAT